MDCFEKELMKIRERREKERQEFLQKALSKMTSELAYHSFLILICERFNFDIKYHIPKVAYVLTDYFINNVSEPFDEWIHKDDAPFVRPLSDAHKIFHEFSFLGSDVKIMEMANKIYGLDLQTVESEYMYSMSFDFNSFTPVDIGEVKDLLTEIRILQKHNVDTSDLENKLDEYGFSDEQLELIGGGD